MHLDHKIPWNTVASHFQYVCDNIGVTPQRTGLFPGGLPSQANDLNHFRSRLIATIREFSKTQQLKTPDLPPSTDSSSLFSDDVLFFPERRYRLGPHKTNSARHNPLSHRHQEIEYWTQSAKDPYSVEPRYSSNDGDLADAVKMLILICAEGEQSVSLEAQMALCRLARHPKIPLDNLRCLSWGHSFGFDHMARRALEAYLTLNIFAAVLECESRRFAGQKPLLQARSFVTFVQNAVADYDFPAQNVLHREFWTSMGITSNGAWHREHASPEDGPVVTDPLQPHSTEQVRSGMKRYLKTCFAVLSTYDMLLREFFSDTEADAFWSYDIVGFDLFRSCRSDTCDTAFGP